MPAKKTKTTSSAAAPAAEVKPAAPVVEAAPVAPKKTAKKTVAPVAEVVPPPAPAAPVVAEAPVKKAPAAKAKKAAVAEVTPVAPAAPVEMPKPKVTKVIAQIDVGFGNAVYLRGEGAGLSWSMGVPMACVGGTAWEWSVEGATAPVTFKVVLRDEVWANGENLVVVPGDTLVFTPTFSE